MQATVIISTFNQPEWLGKVLHGYRRQAGATFEVIIADDGSDDTTRAVIEASSASSPFPIRHVRHDHEGYRRQTILNEALRLASTGYIIMTDGDCIPRSDFVATHLRHARKGAFVSGGYCKLPMALSKAIQPEDIDAGRACSASWLALAGLRSPSSLLKLGCPGAIGAVLDRLTPTKPTWNNCNSSGWLDDLVSVNGFNEDMKYGGADRELGERLANRGIRGIQLRHRAIVVHLDHARGYKTKDTIERNRAIRAQVVSSGSTWCENGLVKGPRP
jgi:glycosyltransferase involved in cell wall biosynthesis